MDVTIAKVENQLFAESFDYMRAILGVSMIY